MTKLESDILDLLVETGPMDVFEITGLLQAQEGHHIWISDIAAILTVLTHSGMVRRFLDLEDDQAMYTYELDYGEGLESVLPKIDSGAWWTCMECFRRWPDNLRVCPECHPNLT
jgi:hypothetical protein